MSFDITQCHYRTVPKLSQTAAYGARGHSRLGCRIRGSRESREEKRIRSHVASDYRTWRFVECDVDRESLQA
jgi:hypothetical protein